METGRWTRWAAGVVAGATLVPAALAVPSAADSGAGAGGVEVRHDVAYRTVDGEKLRLDVYEPSKAGKRLPAVVIVHGGGWRQGDKGDWEQQGRRLADAGFVAFSVNYRLVPAHPYPAAVDDVEAAVEWVRKHADAYGVDRKRVGALGGSAGGHLVGMLATDGSGALDRGHRIAAGVSWSGPMDFTGGTIPGAARPAGGTVAQFIGCSPTECADKYAEASPITHVDKTDAPLLLVNSTMETVPQAQTQKMHAALDKMRVPNQMIILPGRAHSRAYSNRVWDQTVAFLGKYLKK